MGLKLVVFLFVLTLSIIVTAACGGGSGMNRHQVLPIRVSVQS